MATPPAGSSLLFGALADFGSIKQRKNGTYRMVLKGIDEIDWFTDRPDRVAGEWSPKKLVRKWDGLFRGVEPNAQATFEVGSKRKLLTFEMFKPQLSDSNQTLSFKVRGISQKSKDLLTGLRNKRISDPSLFIDDGAYYNESWVENLVSAMLVNPPWANGWDLSGVILSGANLGGANLYGANLNGADISWAGLVGANLNGANLSDASLNDTDLTTANLTAANLTGADLTNSLLGGVTTDFATWSNTTCPDGSNSDNNPSGGF